MFEKLLEALKALSTSDKYLLGVSALVLINHKLAMLLATIVLSVFIYRAGKALKEYLDKH